MLKGDPKYLYQIPRIYEGLDELLISDPVFKTWGLAPENFLRPYYGAGFPALCRIVIGQQVSTHAADALWRRFEDGLPNVTPNAVLILKQDDLRQLGLSQQKAGYIFNLAEKINAGEFNPQALEHMPDEDVYNAITALKGFGNWSAEIFLMFCLARPDVFPAGDLGIQEGLRKYYGMEKRPSESQALEMSKHFAPHRTAASILLWHLKELKD